MSYEIYCPKCDDANVEIVKLGKQEKPRRVSIDELPDKIYGGAMTLGYIQHTYLAICKTCGYQREFKEK